MIPAMKPRTVHCCRSVAFVISARAAPFFRWRMATTSAVSLPSRGAAQPDWGVLLGGRIDAGLYFGDDKYSVFVYRVRCRCLGKPVREWPRLTAWRFVSVPVQRREHSIDVVN